MSGFGNGERDNALREHDWRQRIQVIEPACLLNKKENVLEEADRITAGQRRDHYGHPLDDFSKVVNMAQALWGRGPETPEEHALYLVFVKLAREAHEHKRDNLVDIAGYIKCYEEIIEERKRRASYEDGRSRP